MSTAEPACYSTPEDSGLRVETIPFERIPHQTRLFLDYLKDPVSLRKYYPSAVRFHHEFSNVYLKSFRPTVSTEPLFAMRSKPRTGVGERAQRR